MMQTGSSKSLSSMVSCLPKWPFPLLGRYLQIACLLFCSVVMAESMLHPGGPGADLSKVEIGGQGRPTGPNLFANGDFHNAKEWSSSIFVDPAPGLSRAVAEPQLRKLTEKSFVHGEGDKLCARIVTSDKISGIFQNTSGKTALSGYAANFDLPAPLKTQQEYSISFRYRGKSTNTKLANGFYIALLFRNGHKSTGSWGKYNLAMSENWRQAEFRVKAAADTSAIRVNLGLVGAGFCEFGDIVVRSVPPANQKLWVELYVMECVDSSHYEMREKSTVAISIAPYGEKTGNWLNLYVKFPKGIDIIGHGPFLGSPRTPKAVEKVLEDASGVLYRINGDRLPTKDSHYHRTGTILLKNSLAADGKERSMTYYAEDANGKTLMKTMKLVVTKGETSPAPKRFITGGYSATDLMFDNDNAEDALAELYASVGFNAARASFSLNARNIFLKHGIRRFEAIWGMAADGYIFGIDSSKKPEDVLFKGIDGKPFRSSHGREEFKTGICPVVLYTKSAYRENVIKKVFAEAVNEKRMDFLYANWEPVVFDFRGCFCERCRDEFIRYSGISAEKVKAVWPKDVLNVYRDQWVKFRSWQHSKVIGMVVDMLDELSAENNTCVEFAPGVHHLSAKENSGFGLQYKVDDYMDKIRWIVLWGPYLYYDYSTPYSQNIGYHLHIWNQAEFNMKYLTRRLKDSKKRPKLVALPNLQQPEKCYVIEPESPAFETLTYFVQGWNGSLVYFLPIGVDNRYWNSFARANRQIAAYEDYVFDGCDFRNYSVQGISPLPQKAVASWETIKDPDSVPKPDTTLLQSKAYRLKDAYLFAIGNFWENGECFFTLKVHGLDTTKQWYISQPDSGKSFGSFRSSELEAGITLHVGAMRWAFYVISPKALPGCTKAVGQGYIHSTLKERLPAITKRYEKDMQVIAGATAQKKTHLNDISGLSAVKNGDVVMSPAGQLLQIKTPAYTAKIDLDRGVVLNSLVSSDGTEWAGKQALGMTRVMAPGKFEFIDNGFRFLGCEPQKNGSILVKTERRFMDGKYPKLAGLIILKTIEFSKDSLCIRESFKNGSDSEVVLSVSSHNFPNALSFKGKETGTARMEGAAYSRCSVPWTYKIGSSPLSALQQRYNKSGKFTRIKDGVVAFTAPWSKMTLTAAWCSHQADFLAYWGTFDMACGTFEVHWQPFALPPNATETRWLKWTLVNKNQE